MWNLFKKKEKLPSLVDQYVKIMENFNFKRVAEFMAWNESYWSYNDDGSYEKGQWMVVDRKVGDKWLYKVPTEHDLRLMASDLLRRVMDYKENVSYIATGPFKATKRYGILELECIIERWSYD